MNDLEAGAGPRINLILAGIFLVIVVGGLVDLVLDDPETLFSAHVFFEVLMVSVSLLAATYLARGWYQARVSLVETTRMSVALEEERRQWKERAAVLLSGLSDAISAQFDEWSLTPTERKVALQLLQGLSHKRIARMNEQSERTVRQHSVAVYRKSGLAGRAELAGFFLEPLLLPEDGSPSEGDSR